MSHRGPTDKENGSRDLLSLVLLKVQMKGLTPVKATTATPQQLKQLTIQHQLLQQRKAQQQQQQQQQQATKTTQLAQVHIYNCFCLKHCVLHHFFVSIYLGCHAGDRKGQRCWRTGSAVVNCRWYRPARTARWCWWGCRRIWWCRFDIGYGHYRLEARNDEHRDNAAAAASHPTGDGRKCSSARIVFELRWRRNWNNNQDDGTRPNGSGSSHSCHSARNETNDSGIWACPRSALIILRVRPNCFLFFVLFVSRW